VVWLSQANETVVGNLRAAAAARQIDPDRLVFAPRLDDAADHLARLCLADLFLDTLPYNAHATACDALWAGLPVVTCRGKAFAGRVAASLLEAVGLPDLVTQSLAEYEALALRLARDPVALAAVKARLSRNRATSPLFDADRFRRHIEAAYVAMWERWQRGESPRSFAVEPSGETVAATG
jgi:protein O-GlcNAc transferase